MRHPVLQGGEDDLDALLAKFALEDKMQSSVEVVDDSAPPSARVYSSFTPVSPQQVCILDRPSEGLFLVR